MARGGMRAPTRDARSVTVEVDVPGHVEFYPFELELLLDGQLADTLRLETPASAGRRTLTGALPPAANAGPAVEVMLRTHSYWSGITDFTMRSYILVSAGQR